MQHTSSTQKNTIRAILLAKKKTAFTCFSPSPNHCKKNLCVKSNLTGNITESRHCFKKYFRGSYLAICTIFMCKKIRKQQHKTALIYETGSYILAYVLMDDQESEIGLFPSGGLHTCSWLFPSGGFSYRSCSKRAFIRCSVSTFFISRFMAVVVKPVAQPRSYKSTIILSDSSPSEQLNLSTTRAFLNTISMFEYLKFSEINHKNSLQLLNTTRRRESTFLRTHPPIVSLLPWLLRLLNPTVVVISSPPSTSRKSNTTWNMARMNHEKDQEKIYNNVI